MVRKWPATLFEFCGVAGPANRAFKQMAAITATYIPANIFWSLVNFICIREREQVVKLIYFRDKPVRDAFLALVDCKVWNRLAVSRVAFALLAGASDPA